MPTSWNIEWLNSNASRAFPFKENSSLIGEDTSIKLPNYILVDAVITVAYSNPASYTFYVNKFNKAANYLTIAVADGSGLELGYITVDTNLHTTNKAYYIISAEDEYEDAMCKLVVGDLSSIDEDIPDCNLTFTATTTPFEERVIRPNVRGVRALQLINGTDVSRYIRGAVKLIAGNNIKLSEETYTINNITYPAIRIDSRALPSWDVSCPCGESFDDRPCIKSINNVFPDDAGNIQLTGDECVVVTAGASNTITIKNPCVIPCCGCTELEFLVQNLKIIEKALQVFDSRLLTLQAHQDILTSNINFTKI